jgi:hypothetical protein
MMDLPIDHMKRIAKQAGHEMGLQGAKQILRLEFVKDWSKAREQDFRTLVGCTTLYWKIYLAQRAHSAIKNILSHFGDDDTRAELDKIFCDAFDDSVGRFFRKTKKAQTDRVVARRRRK